MLVRSSMVSTSTICMKRALLLFKTVSKDSSKSSHKTISLWWPLPVPKVQTSITLKCLSCLANKNFKAEECQSWSLVKPFLLSSLTIQIQEPQVSSVTDFWLVSDTKSFISIVWLEEKVLLIQLSKHQEVVIFKDVWWSIWKVLRLSTITQWEIVMEVLSSFCTVKILWIPQKKSSLTKWNFWVRIWLCLKKSLNTTNSRVTWNGIKLRSSKRQRLARQKLFYRNSIQERTLVRFHKSATRILKQPSFRSNSMKFIHWNTNTIWSSQEKQLDVQQLNQSVSHRPKWPWILSTWQDTEVSIWHWVFLVLDNCSWLPVTRLRLQLWNWVLRKKLQKNMPWIVQRRWIGSSFPNWSSRSMLKNGNNFSHPTAKLCSDTKSVKDSTESKSTTKNKSSLRANSSSATETLKRKSRTQSL